jgi:uridine kinase
MNVFVLGISGGSGSGKTTFARYLKDHFNEVQVSILAQDNYYFDQSSKFVEDGGEVNFDHPDALDFSRLELDLQKLKAGQAVEIPDYDFSTHKRKNRGILFHPADLIILEGTLIFTQPKILNLLEYAVFIETPEATRLERRIRRDTEERGRTVDGVKKQFEKQVKPMHDLFVQPSAKNADRLVDGQNFDMPKYSTDLLQIVRQNQTQ